MEEEERRAGNPASKPRSGPAIYSARPSGAGVMQRRGGRETGRWELPRGTHQPQSQRGMDALGVPGALEMGANPHRQAAPERPLQAQLHGDRAWYGCSISLGNSLEEGCFGVP